MFAVCNRTYYGDVGKTYQLALHKPREERLPFLCHLTFTANGHNNGELVQVTLVHVCNLITRNHSHEPFPSGNILHTRGLLVFQKFQFQMKQNQLTNCNYKWQSKLLILTSSGIRQNLTEVFVARYVCDPVTRKQLHSFWYISKCLL